MAQTVTLSSVGISAGLILDYIGATTTTAQVTPNSSSMTFDATLQVTLNSSMRGEAIVWAALSSIHYAAEAIISILSPIAGLRISSTALSSSALTLTALQTVGG